MHAEEARFTSFIAGRPCSPQGIGAQVALLCLDDVCDPRWPSTVRVRFMASAGLSAKPLATGGINREECHDREVAKTSLNITRIYGIYRSSEVQPLSGCSEYTPRPAGASIRIVNVRLLPVRDLNRDIRAACCRLPRSFWSWSRQNAGVPRTSSVKYGLTAGHDNRSAAERDERLARLYHERRVRPIASVEISSDGS
jgi:hypothetical protein